VIEARVGMEVVCCFSAWLELMGLGRRVEKHLAGVSWMLKRKGIKDVTKDPIVKLMVKGVKRESAVEKMEVRELFPIEVLRGWVKKDVREGVRKRRDPAIVVLGMRLMLRPTELCNLDMRHVKKEGEGLKVFIKKSKCDQTMEGRWMRLDRVEGSVSCPV
jgi:integrase